ncbi:MAG: hypothetical protein ACPG6V_03830 [Flavobacteriales bacterium]
MNNRIKFSFLIAVALSTWFFFTSVDNNSIETFQKFYEQSPPIPKQFWVQKIKPKQGVSNGSGYAIILRTKFVNSMPLPEELEVYMMEKQDILC